MVRIMRDSIKWVANRMPKSDDRQLSIMSLGNVAKARFFHSSFPQYSITPLARLDGMAKYLGLGGLFVKDESFRFGLNAFKVLGGSFAMARYIAKEMGILTVGVVTKPFNFEGRRRMMQAEKGIEELRTRVDSLVIIPNERLKLATDQKITMVNAFEIADDVLRQAVPSISDLIKNTGFINLDFADVTAVMQNAGMAHMGVGRAGGKNKAEDAAKMAISSPLLETSINGAKGVLINVTGSMDIGLEEVEQAASLVQAAVHPDALTIFGATFDETLDDEIRVTVIATGFDKVPEQLPKVPPIQAGAAGQQSAAAEPMPLKEEDVPKPEEPEDDPFEDIFKIFNKRD